MKSNRTRGIYINRSEMLRIEDYWRMRLERYREEDVAKDHSRPVIWRGLREDKTTIGRSKRLSSNKPKQRNA